MPKPASASPRPSSSPSATGRPQQVFGLTVLSLRSVSSSERHVAVDGSYGDLEQVDSDSSRSARSNATFTVVAGLAKASCFSLRDENGRYLRHTEFRIRAHADDGSELFDNDATFCRQAGSVPGAVMLESHNFPGYYLHARGGELWIDKLQDSAAFRRECSFVPVAALD